MRASRLMSTLLLLQSRGRLTADEIAEELGVSVRTVYRDMESLSAAGIPLYGQAGKDGGYQLLDGYQTRLTGLTVGEAQSLFFSGVPDAADDLGLGGVLATAQMKLMAALPEPLRENAEHIRQRFHLDTLSWYRDSDSTPFLAELAGMVWNQQSVRLRYLRWEAPHEVSRDVQPYGLVLKAGRWYLVAGTGEDIRTYRVSRIVDLQPAAAHFDRPAGFDLAAYWQGYLRRFDARRHVGEATVLLSPTAWEQVSELMENTVVRRVLETAEPATRPGWTRVRMPIESLETAAAQLLRFGTGALVTEPSELRRLMHKLLGELLVMYADDDGSSG